VCVYMCASSSSSSSKLHRPPTVPTVSEVNLTKSYTMASTNSTKSLLVLNEDSKNEFLNNILDKPANVSQFPSKESEEMALAFGANSDFSGTFDDEDTLELRREERICFFGSVVLNVRQGELECMGYVLRKGIEVTIHSPKWGAAMSIRGVEKTSRVRLKSTSSSSKSFEILLKVSSHAAASKSNRVVIPSEWSDVVKTVNEGDVVVTCGSTGVGKSTLNRYLVNALVSSRFVSEDPVVLYVETDVGQSEMTPPGLISVHEIDRTCPLLGPPHTHIRQPLASHFYGANTPSADPNRFIACVQRIFLDIAEIRKRKKYSAVVVNTCGYVRGLGSNLLATVIMASSPKHVLEIQGTSISKRFEVPETGCEFQTTRLPTWFEAMEKMLSSSKSSSSQRNMNNGVKGKEARRLQLSAYFAPFRGTSSVKHTEDAKWRSMSQLLEIIRPVRTSIKSLKFCVLHEDLSLSASVLRAFDVSLVGLCVSSSSSSNHDGSTTSIHNTTTTTVRIVRDHINVTKCMGLGIVRSVNLKKDELLLITPIPLHLLQDVDTLVLGPLTMPPSFVRDRSTIASRRPYLNRSNGSGIMGTSTMQSRRDLKRRKFQPK